MMLDDVSLLGLAGRMSDREAIDWDDAERRAEDEAQRCVIRHLRLVDAVARAHRTWDELEELDEVEATVDDILGARSASEARADPTEWGHLQVRELLGRGAFGDVYRARDSQLDRDVALKLLRPGRHDERALEEARRLVKVRHENVVTVHGADVHDGRVGFWMERVEGKTLAELVREQGAFGAREAAGIGVELCRALSAVHARGLVHRDVKAQNAMRAKGGRILLVDFGTSSDMEDARGQSAQFVGTPLYMAPELLSGNAATPQSDIYSMGVLLFHLVSAEYPTSIESVAELQRAHQLGNVTLLRDVRSDLPEAFVRVVEKALAREPRDRYQTAGEMEQALSAALDLDVPAVTPGRPSRFGPWLLAAATIVVLAIVFAGQQSGWRFGGALAVADVVAMEMYRIEGTRAERIHGGASLAAGDRVALDVRLTEPRYVYVFHEDATGKASALFPIDGGTPRNPLQATRNRLPGTTDGLRDAWPITPAGKRERFSVLASPFRLSDFERLLAEVGPPVAAPEVRHNDRGVLPPETTRVPAGDRVLTFAAERIAARRAADGVVLRSIEFVNP